MGEDWGYLTESLISSFRNAKSNLELREMKRIAKEKQILKRLFTIGKLLNQYSTAKGRPVIEAFELMFFPSLSKIMISTGSTSFSERLKSLDNMIDAIKSRNGDMTLSKQDRIRLSRIRLSKQEKND